MNEIMVRFTENDTGRSVEYLRDNTFSGKRYQEKSRSVC